MNPFTSVVVQPMYGVRRMLIRWTVAQPYEELGLLVYRSIDGGVTYTLLNPNADLLFRVDEFLDPDIPVASKLTDLFYRIGVEQNGEILSSPPVAPFGDLHRAELTITHRIITAEYEKLSRETGIAMLHFVPKASGEPNPYRDLDTGAMVGQECRLDEVQSYGLPFVGGYAPPVHTWVKFGPQKLEELQQGDSAVTVERRIAPVRMLCWPRPRLDHLLVNPVTDERWGVGPVVVPYLFKGIAVVAYDATLHLLNRTDTRYRLDISPYR